MLEKSVDESTPLISKEEKITNISNKNFDTGIMKIQHNLIRMGFDLTMVNKILSNYKITTEEEAIDYLIKSDDGMWNHPFIPIDEEPELPDLDLLAQPKNVMSGVLTRINTLKRSSSVDQITSLMKEEDENNLISKTRNLKISQIKKKNDDICEICGEAKEFHRIKDFRDPHLSVEDDKFETDNLSNDINEPQKINNDDINTNIINPKEEEIEDKSDPNICQICMDDFENPLEMENCKHKFCQECFHSYLIERIKHNQIDQMPCPKKNCKNQNLSENFFSQYLSEQEYFKFRQFRAQNEIARDSRKVFCPLCDSYADIGEGESFILDSNNPEYSKTTLKCQNGHEFCSCGRPTHEGDCYRDEKEFKELLIQEDIKKCPKCGFLIKKNRGCNHMTCGNPSCKYEFCWLCMKECVPNHFDYGPCSGKQFFDPDSFEHKLKQSHPWLYKQVNSINATFLLFALFTICFFIPGFALSFVAFLFVFLQEDNFGNLKTSAKIIIFLGYVCMGFAYESLVYLAFILVTGLVMVFIAFGLIYLVCVILMMLIRCLFNI